MLDTKNNMVESLLIIGLNRRLFLQVLLAEHSIDKKLIKYFLR